MAQGKAAITPVSEASKLGAHANQAPKTLEVCPIASHASYLIGLNATLDLIGDILL